MLKGAPHRPNSGPDWQAKKGKYIHERGCGAGPDEPCTCEPPYPRAIAALCSALAALDGER